MSNSLRILPTKTVCAFHISTTHAICSARFVVLHFKQALASKATSSPSALHTYIHTLPPTRLLIWKRERNTIKLRAQFFLRMKTWMLETCRRHYNKIKTLMKKCAFCWFLLHRCITMRVSKNVRFTNKILGTLSCLVQLGHVMSGDIYIYRVSHELRSLLRESVPYVKIYRYNPKHLCPKLNGYGDNGQRSFKL